MMEFTAHALNARQKMAWRGAIAAEMALADAQRASRERLWQWVVTRGIVILDSEDYPLVACHDWGCEVSA
jgi:hypothetical protein